MCKAACMVKKKTVLAKELLQCERKACLIKERRASRPAAHNGGTVMGTNFHTHTVRCHHAAGTEREFIEAALAAGFTELGFSDHSPYPFSDGHVSHFRMALEETAEYFETLRALQAEYADRIAIHIGFEAEYYPRYFEAMREHVRAHGCDYLILGQHFTSPEINPDAFFVMKPHDDKEQLTKYADLIVEAINTGVFTYVAHPDAFYFTGDSDFYKEQMKKICITSKEKDIPVELNFLGIRDNRHYPNELFWQVAGEVGCPVVFGFDAHNPLSAFDNQSFARANELVNKFNLNYIGKPDIILIQEKKPNITLKESDFYRTLL